MSRIHRSVYCLFATMFLLVAPSGPNAAAEETRSEPERPADTPPVLELEPVGEDLAEVEWAGLVLIAGSDSGKEILLLDTGTSMLYRLLESGRLWGEPVYLRELSRIEPTHMAAGDGLLALLGSWKIGFYAEDGALEHVKDLFSGGDIGATADGEWLVSLRNVPHPGRPGKFVGRSEFGDEVPRILLLDESFASEESGLESDDTDLDPSTAAGKTLVVAAGDRRHYAAELGDYRIYELDDRLRLRSELSDPKLEIEDPAPAASEARATEMEEAAREISERQGKDLSGSRKEAPGTAISFDFTRVVRDVAWDSRSDRLLLLLADGGDRAGEALDVIDPFEGTVRRFALRRASTEVPLYQIVAGKEYLWLRGRRAEGRLYRIERLELMDRGLPIELSKRERMSASFPNSTGLNSAPLPSTTQAPNEDLCATLPRVGEALLMSCHTCVGSSTSTVNRYDVISALPQ